MPSIGIDHVVSCSSADKNNPAENLLKADGTHKWKSAVAGERKVSVVLQLNKSSEIHSIDIGNEASAFVEVLVGKATAAADADFEVLLVASAFMSPLESRNGTNRNSVRMFGPEKLNKQVADKKWDRVKIVCTQPFSKLLSYGLSFIKLNSSSSGDGGEVKVKKLGAFTVKDSDGDDIQIGSLFANRSKVDVPTTPKGAAVIRAATKLAEGKTRPTSPVASSSSSTTDSSNQRKRPSSPSLKYENNLKTKAAKISRDEDSGDDETKRVTGSSEKPPLKKQSTSVSSVASSHSSSKGEKTPLKKNRTEPPSSSPNVKFAKLMEKAVFVLSGFQNPSRGELRDKAIEMGATYKPDWGRGCTHLICAFSNTPKYQQVKGKGKIVTKRWVEDCHKQRKILPWRKYRLGDAESPDESSSEEEEEYKPPQKTPAQPSLSSAKVEQQAAKSSSKKQPVKKGIQFTEDSDSGGDTEDELRKLDEKSKAGDRRSSPVSTNSSKPTKKDPYGNSTDEDDIAEAGTMPIPDSGDEDGSDSGLPDLPEFFTDKHFFFYGDFEDAQRRLLTRYISAYNGEIEDYMSSKVVYVITSQKWDDNFDTALNDNPNLVFVRPKWILACHEKGKLAPYQPHIVVP